MTNQPKRVLTIQSHVAFGHVGNSAAVFTLQRMGIEAMPINTVQFSNHSGYDVFSGQVFTAEQISDVLRGLRENHFLEKVDAVISGYIGKVGVGQVIHDVVREIRKYNPEAMYVCDPVMGDKEDGVGFFVDETIPPLMKEALESATIITPNYFEFEVLCGKSVKTLEDACSEARKLIANNHYLKTVLITSFRVNDTDDELMTLAITADEAWKVTTPRCHYVPMPSGTGDTFTALYLAHTLNGDSVEKAITYTTSTLYALVKDTPNGSHDLSLVREQAQIIEPKELFKAERLF